MSIFRALTHRPFALFWVGQTISYFGNSFYSIALAWWILEKTGSAAEMGLVLVMGRIPMILFLLYGGVTVDRISKTFVLLLSNLFWGSMIIIVTLLVWNDALLPWHIYVVSILSGIVNAFFIPAYYALIPEIVPQDTLASANSLASLSMQVAGVVGPSLAAYVVFMGGTFLAFGVDGLSFFIAALSILPLLRLHGVSTASHPSQGIMKDLRDGLREVFSSQWISLTIVISALSSITIGGPVTVALPLLVKEHYHMGVAGIGWFTSMISIGSVLGAVILGRSKQLHGRGIKIYTAIILSGVLTLILGWAAYPGVIIAMAIGLGVFGEGINLIWLNTLQTLVPTEKLGRVFSVDRFGSALFTPVGFALTGWAADQYGPSLIFMLGGAITAGIGALALLHPAIRKLD